MTDWTKHLEAGSIAYEEGNLAVARGHFFSAWTSNPHHPLTNYVYGMELSRTGHRQEAIERLQEAWSQDSSLVPAACQWVRLRLLEDICDVDAVEQLDKLSGRFPEDTLIMMTRLEYYMMRGNIDDAIIQAEILERYNPEDGHIAMARVNQLRGLIASSNDNNQEALEWFRRASELDSDWAGPVINQGVLLEKAGLTEKALEMYKKALKIEPQHPVALYDVARIYYLMENRFESSNYLKQLLAEYPEYPGGEDLARAILEIS
ncbi:MAG: tetratricopeptide repeat protein [Deltaproteobacteria bacterium]|nr:tetratricopeptide repeat protein [Deltaproteobacteria bacterium]